jgi:hypothetical protein
MKPKTAEKGKKRRKNGNLLDFI